MYPYHNKIKQRIKNNELIHYEYLDKYKDISPCLLLHFDKEPYTRPIRQHRFLEYEELFKTLLANAADNIANNKNKPLANMKKLLIILTLLCSFSFSQAQESININGVDCDIHGSAHPERPEYRLNEYKNRYHLPTKSDYDNTINLHQLMTSSDEDAFPIDKAVILTGYVFNVKMGGVETCNCKTKDAAYRDTHIELTPDDQHTSPEYRVIVEVTPRIRAIMAAKGIDWSTETLKETLIGHKVKISGWLFYDAEHKSQAYANNPGNERDWRASCWEIHPITYIKVLD